MAVPPGNILLIRGGAIGDFVLTLPAIATLRAAYPHARLSLLGYPHIARLALAGGLVDEVRSLEARGLASFFGADAELPADLATSFRGCDLIVSYLFDPHAIFRENIARCSDAQFLACPHRPSEVRTLHATEVFLAPLAGLGLRPSSASPRLAIPPQPLPRSQGEHWLAVHPGSGSEKKNWPEPLWMQLLACLAEDHRIRLLLVGGEAEGERLTRFSRVWPAARLLLARSLPLTELAARLAGCDFFIGHDSGIMHLATALDMPGLALWGHDNQTVWGPRSTRMRIVRASAGLASIAPEVVLDRVVDFFARNEHA